MEWTREERYRAFSEMPEETKKQLELTVQASNWRQLYHIQPPFGLLNDPNGFSFYNGRYHLFYQWFPYGAVHGLKNWYHTSSADLVAWEEHGPAIEPGKPFDSHGAFSGSGIVSGDNLYLFYTGNQRDQNWNRKSSQCLAVMDKQGKIKKNPCPIIDHQPAGYTAHFRDPKVWKANNCYYMVIGAQREDETGCVLLYSSTDLQTWEWLGEMKTKERNFGFMWECPDYFELDGHGVLLFCPQGLAHEQDRFQNIYQSGAFVGEKLDYETGEFNHNDFQELDAGFDFYAPQTTETPDGRRILVGWMGLPEISYPTDRENWAHCLTIPRELSERGGKIFQSPVKEMEKKRRQHETASAEATNEEVALGQLSGSHYEMICELYPQDAGTCGLKLRTGENEETVLFYDPASGKVGLDRSKSGEKFAEKYGTVRYASYQGDIVRFHIFMDTSSIEVFVGDGDAVFTARLFPSQQSEGIKFFAKDGTSSVKAVKWSYE
ncbi:sucrose-6-phosphate hydrolase [Bacillaceae bacterium Marseille-Q3522]|nr:sucrose-6-phosphate hydrolase [Bacillaceae bacterium Marseille-Q3522]